MVYLSRFLSAFLEEENIKKDQRTTHKALKRPCFGNRLSLKGTVSRMEKDPIYYSTKVSEAAKKEYHV